MPMLPVGTERRCCRPPHPSAIEGNAAIQVRGAECVLMTRSETHASIQGHRRVWTSSPARPSPIYHSSRRECSCAVQQCTPGIASPRPYSVSLSDGKIFFLLMRSMTAFMLIPIPKRFGCRTKMLEAVANIPVESSPCPRQGPSHTPEDGCQD